MCTVLRMNGSDVNILWCYSLLDIIFDVNYSSSVLLSGKSNL